MKDFLSKIPLPITVLALGWVLLSSIFQGVIPLISDISVIISLILIVLSILKIIFDIKNFYLSIKSSVGLSLFSAFSISLMLISVWMKGVLGQANIYIWATGVVLHIIIMILFTIRYVINFNIKYVFASWFLVYSGLGMASITCKEFGMIVFGGAVFKFTIVVSIILVPFIVVRLFKRSTTNAARPLFSLISIPIGIILPSYIVVSESIVLDRLWVMFFISQIILLLVIINMLSQMYRGFYPSLSCYAASSAATLYAAKFFSNYLKENKIYNQYLDYVLYGEYFLVFIICAAILLIYFIKILTEVKSKDKGINSIKTDSRSVKNISEKKLSLKSNEERINKKYKPKKSSEEPKKVEDMSDLLD
ncbi:TDT family transporter [Peptostreptococcus faecalis]|uniref:hypothetical protein n=1 Tax=Peptostreptococcus faecalis TaxID=2045015 RepID=UPI000C7CF17C|nr:hypothetical protein [Peptostreptococcus faecalis]